MRAARTRGSAAKWLGTLLIALSLTMASGCGQKGPLYLPGQKKSKVPANEPPAQPPAPGAAAGPASGANQS